MAKDNEGQYDEGLCTQSALRQLLDDLYHELHEFENDDRK